MAVKTRNGISQSGSLEAIDSYRTRIASLPLPLIALIIVLMGIAKYFG
jgi:hypothetical protein